MDNTLHNTELYGDLAVREIIRQEHLNHMGKAFGGHIMGQIDVAGLYPAMQYTKGTVVTRFIKEINFSSFIELADIVSYYAKISKVGNTSITVVVTVVVDRLVDLSSFIFTQTEVVYVAVHPNGKPRQIHKREDYKVEND